MTISPLLATSVRPHDAAITASNEIHTGLDRLAISVSRPLSRSDYRQRRAHDPEDAVGSGVRDVEHTIRVERKCGGPDEPLRSGDRRDLAIAPDRTQACVPTVGDVHDSIRPESDVGRQ